MAITSIMLPISLLFSDEKEDSPIYLEKVGDSTKEGTHIIFKAEPHAFLCIS